MNLSRCCLGVFLLVFLFAASVVEASLTDGLVLYLPFDEGQGEVAGDLSGNGHDGTLEGPEWTEGEFGNALSFDGVEAFVDVPFSDDFVITEGITLGAWVAANVPFSPEWKGIINAQQSTYGPFYCKPVATQRPKSAYILAGPGHGFVQTSHWRKEYSITLWAL